MVIITGKEFVTKTNRVMIMEQKKCWQLLAEKFDRFQTLRNNMQQEVQTDTTCNIQQCWELLANNVASVCTGLYGLLQIILKVMFYFALLLH